MQCHMFFNSWEVFGVCGRHRNLVKHTTQMLHLLNIYATQRRDLVKVTELDPKSTCP